MEFTHLVAIHMVLHLSNIIRYFRLLLMTVKYITVVVSVCNRSFTQILLEKISTSVQNMILQKLILPLVSITAMGTAYVAASVIAHNDSSTVNFRSAVSISYQSHHNCMGVILNKRWIITSANCIQNHSNITELLISYGSADRNAAERTRVGPEKIVLHPKFDSVSLVNNVALIKTKNDINFNDAVEPAKLPTYNTMEDEKAYAIGWTNANEKVLLNILYCSIFHIHINACVLFYCNKFRNKRMGQIC